MPLSTRPAVQVKHVQTTPSTVWRIVHGQGGYPVVDTFVDVDGTVQRIIPLAVLYIDESTCEIQFSIPRAGFARVIV